MDFPMDFCLFCIYFINVHLIWKKPTTVTRQLTKSRAFWQNYLCDFHLWTGPNPLTWQVCRMREPAQSRRAWAPRSCWWAGSAASGPGATHSGSDRNSGPWIHTTTITFQEHYMTKAEEKRMKNNPVLRIRIKLKGRIRIGIKVISWIRIRTQVRSWIRIRINLQTTSQNVQNMSLFELFQGFEPLFRG